MKLVAASNVIEDVCRSLKYSRSHVAKILRENARRLGAKQRDGRWLMRHDRESLLSELVVSQSGRRYRLRERGPQRRNAA